MESITLDWTDELNFTLDGTEPCQALSAKRLMLLALGKCAAVTALSMMTKMRLHITRFRLVVTGTLTEREVRDATVFTSFHQHYIIETTEEKELERIVRAVELTLARYCSVSLMMEMIAPLSYELTVNGMPAPLPEEIALEK